MQREPGMKEVDMYDAVIVGARCAGSPLAMLLAKRGHRVLLVDRAHFPSDTMSTHFIQLPGMARLKSWGLVDPVFETNCPPVKGAKLDIQGQVIEVDFPPLEGVPGLAAPRRTVLDEILVRAAVDAGAELIEGVSVDSLRFDGDRVGGIEGHTSEGRFSADARFVVGADGKNSAVAREVEAEFTRRFEPETSGYYSYYSGVDVPATELYLNDDTIGVSFPTNDGLTVVAVEWANDRFGELKKDIEGNFLAAVDKFGTLGERVRGGTRAERFVGAADIPLFLREAHGPGWALCGDACYHKDPAPADGISDAFRAADLLAEALDDVLSDRVSEDEALAPYQERHHEAAFPALEATKKMVSLELSPMERANAFIELRGTDLEEATNVISAREIAT
jgi:flavin-dependent dehydrogenase